MKELDELIAQIERWTIMKELDELIAQIEHGLADPGAGPTGSSVLAQLREIQKLQVVTEKALASDIELHDMLRLWNLSRSVVRRLNYPVSDFPKLPPGCESMPIKELLALSGACEIIQETTDRIAGYPHETAPDLG